ncbi:MAG: hypothetical protein V4450_00090 [Bacteroidota bacterium]
MTIETIALPMTKRGQQVDTNHVDKLVGNYKKQRWVKNSSALGRPDSMSIWYGLDELQTFLELAREHKADGIKMFFGVYPENFAPRPELSGLQTIVLVATRQSKTVAGVMNKSIYIDLQGSKEILAFNFGSACPPYCTSDYPPYDSGLPSGIEMEKLGLSIIETSDGITII